MVAIDRIVDDAQVAVPMIAGAALERHEQVGDLAELQARATRDGAFQGTILRNYLVTDEENYTCANCGAEFPNNRRLIAHVEARECGG